LRSRSSAEASFPSISPKGLSCRQCLIAERATALSQTRNAPGSARRGKRFSYRKEFATARWTLRIDTPFGRSMRHNLPLRLSGVVNTQAGGHSSASTSISRAQQSGSLHGRSQTSCATNRCGNRP